MNAFEAARLKHAKNLERRQRQEPPPPNLPQVEPVAVPKEKSRTDALIQVSVYLPNGAIVFALTKRQIMANVHPSKLNEAEFKKAVVRGLEPLLGAIE